MLPLTTLLSGCLDPSSNAEALGGYFADANWNNAEPAPYGEIPYQYGDCTNFVSAALNNANPKFQMDEKYYNSGSASAWWTQGPATSQHSNSWATVEGFYHWLTETAGQSDGNPYSTAVGQIYSEGYAGTPKPPDIVPNSGIGGVIFYVWDWNPSLPWDGQLAIPNGLPGLSGHDGLIVQGNGKVVSVEWLVTPSTGTIVDTHDSNHKHEFWTLQYFNSNWMVTAIRPVTFK